MFRTDFIPYKIIPISNFRDLSAANEELLQGHDDIRNIIMLGCGGIVDLSEFISVSEEISVYVIDNHRPYNLNNIFNNSQITIIDDGYIEENKDNLQDAFFAITNPFEEGEEDEFEDDESFNNEDDETDLDDQENQPNFSNRSARQSPKKKSTSLAYKRMCYEKLEQYLECYWNGTPIASVLFDLCEARGCVNNDMLWYAITGVTDLFLQSSLVEEGYSDILSGLKRTQERLNPNVVQKSAADAKAIKSTSNSMINSDGIISFEHDMKFTLMRHWTLYHSMLHSDFIASRMSAWREKGKKQLEMLLAKMGFPLNQCKTDYSGMDLQYRELLTIQLEKFSKEFNIQKYSFPSFTRDFGYLLKVSAADCVHALRSIIESPTFVSLSRATAVSNESVPIWKSNFFFAFDAIDYKNTEHLKIGIDLAMKQHLVVFKEASTILSHRMIRLSKSFRYVIIKTGLDLEWLQNTHTLQRLAKFLVDSTKDIKKGSALPLVLAVWNSLRDSFTIVSTDGESYFESHEAFKSIVGKTFSEAAQNISARAAMETFDLSCIEVKASDIKSFVKSLQSVLSSTS